MAGAAGVIKDWMWDFLPAERDSPYAIRAMLVGIADGASGGTAGGARTTIHEADGFGHLRATLPAFIGGGLAFWHLTPYTLSSGNTFDVPVGIDSGAESNTINGWKFIATIDVDTYGASPAIRFELVDKCPAGGGQTVLLTSTMTTNKGRLRLRAGDMATMYHNRCLYVRTTVVAASGSFPMYTYDVGYTNPRIAHDM